MAGEAQHTYAVKELDAESKLQDEGTLEQHSDKSKKDSSEHFPSTGTEARTGGRGAKIDKLEKERDYTQQREAVIRPQQAGKIDFRSLQNRPKFATDRTWPSGKSSPQSPSAKSRSREKGKRSGKSERGNPQQLYRLSITNPRSNPTIGIAYPQQKVSPPKKLEASRGPVSGSYRFHVPSIPEREAELQQEELNYNRCFQEASSNLTSPSYTSQALGSTGGNSTHQHPSLSQQQQQQQQSTPMENNSSQPSSQLLLTDFQMSGSNAWQSPERTFNGANYGISSQKSTPLTEVNKEGSFVSVPFQFGYQFLEDSTSNPFPCEQNSQTQDFTDSSLGSGHVTHASFSFASGDGQEVTQNNTQYSKEQQPEDRNSYTQPPQSTQYVQAPQGAASSLHCPRSQSEDSASSDSSGPSSVGQLEQGKSALPESTEVFGQGDSRDPAITSGSKRNCHLKDTTANQRTLIQGRVQHSRSISQGQSPQVHFANKSYQSPPLNNIHLGTVPFDKNINNKVQNRLPHSWEGSNKTYSAVEQNTIQYGDLNEDFQFQNQPPLDQRSNSSKNGRMPWQQLRLTSAIPSQNRIDLSRQINNQKLSYMVSPSDWQDDNKSQKNGPLKSPSSFQNNKTNETFSNQSQDAVKHSTSTMSSFKLEVSHAQVCESKNKPVYFGMNQSLPGGSSRSFNYPQLQVPPVGLMMVSPYESPLPSPVHNPTSSSTCSSLSPASTSPVNLSSEDSQMSKAGAPPFYHQHQAKTQLASDHLSTNQHHFHSDVPRNLHYAPDRAKDNMMSYLQNSVNARTTIDGNKGYMDNFGMEHHQPPPPYSTHQLLATSLAANLDQLDVLLTCKQCDQNFNNLTSFLGHKQYCGQHAFAQIDLKEISKIEDSRKFHADISKAGSNGASTAISRCPSELHLSLLGLNKNGELMCDSETKGDNKEDPMKLSLFSGASNLPVSLPDLEMEDAKLDSLITEALNRLGYQSDNAEIDSSFIDAFADDDLTSVKATSSKQSLKTKESMVADSKSKTVKDVDRALTQGKYLYDSDESPQMHKQYTESTFEKISLNVARDKKNNIKKEVTHQDSGIASRGKSKERDIKGKDASKLFKSEEETSTPRFLFSSKFSEHCGIKSFQDSSEHRASTPSQASTTNQTSPTPRTPVKESKRKRSGGGTWSKELIHKIVQQKNKLHKLHVKGAKNLQFSLVMERLTPAVQNPAFGEYDYVSDSDDECEPVKIASQGRLSQSSRCKYTYTKECKWRARGEREQAAWRHESKECFQVKKSDEVTLSPEKHTSHQRLRRRGSRSSTSSDVSTSVSVSSDAINSPKSNDRTDSDSEKKMEVRRKECPEQKTYERLSSQKFCKEASTQIALTLTKCVKMSSTDQSLHSASKKDSDTLKSYNSNLEDYHPLPSSPKSRSASKNLDKYRSSLAISKQKYESHSRENGTFSYKINTPQRPDKTLHTEETTPSESTDIKDLEADSYSVTVKEIYFNEKNKSACSEGLKTTQPTLPDSSTFEKQNDNLCTAEETITPDEGFVPKSVSLCSSLMDEVCLSPTETQDPLLQKDTSHLIPYPLDQDQGLMKSPLSFDTSSVFGDLTVTGFDNGLYSDIPLQKEGFNSIENAIDKKEGFVSSFSPFLEQRDWGLMVDVSPVLPDEISQYKDNAEKSNEKKSDFNHIPLSLPEKIMDYSVNLNTCASDDELEIKRIVNELENQLQTTKLESPPLLDEDGKHLQMSKFSPLRLDEDSHHDGTALDIHCPVQTLDVPVNGMQSEHFADSVLPWSSPFQFELLGGHHSPHTPTHGEPDILEHFTAKEDDAMNIITKAIHVEPFQLHHDLKTKDTNIEKETAEETKDDILEQKRYTENLMKSLEVISDSIFKKESIMSDPDEMNVTTLKSQHLEIECQATDAIEREDHSEKEAITVKENILSPPNINERKGGIEFILNESLPSLSNSTHPAADGNQPIIFHPSEPVQNNINGTEIKVLTLVEVVDVADDSNMIECLDIGMDCSYVAENTCDKSRALDTVNELFKNNTDDAEHLFTENREEEEEEEEVKGTNSQSESQSASVRQSALPDTGSELGKNEEETGLVDKSANIPSGPENIHSLPADERRGGSSDNVREETEIPVNMSKQDDLSDHAAPGNGSHAEFYTACHSTNMHMEVVIMEKPYSPILMERNIESINQCQNVQDYQSVNEESSPLTLSPSNHILESDVCTVALEQHKSEERFQSSNIQGHEAEVTNVKDIENYLPIPLMASQQCSPCGGNIDVEENLGIPHATPPASPILSTCPPTSLEKLSVQDGPREPQSKCSGITIDQESLQDMHSLKVEGDNQNEPLTTGAEMDYTMMNPPHLDLGITDCKIPSAEASMPSPPSLNSTAEPLEASEDFPKTDSLYDFKLSPLNYNDISNDPPQLNHYDFIPISLPANAEDKADSEQSSRRCSKPCDVSVDPGLIFNKNATVLESDVSLNSDAPTKQSLPDEPLIASAVQESLKSARITLDFPPQNESTQLNSSSNNVMKDLEVYHKPLESIEYLHIHGNLLRKVESENIDSHKAPCVPDSALLKEDISDGFPTSKPLVLCGKEQMNSPQQPTEKQPPVESNQPSTTHQVQREISPKNISGQSSMQQGKALCDICSMCFRTVPGLKRHKAMKHLVKADKNAVLEDATPSLKDNMLSFKEFIITEKGLKDESQTCFQTKIDGLCQSLYSETSNNFLTSNSAETDLAPDRMATDKKTTVAVNETGHHMPSLSAKAKKHYKSKKNKMTEVNNKSDPFSNELLNILKTDILQAITPVFQNRALQERSKSPVEQVKIDEHTNKDITETEPLPFSVASNSESESVSRCPTMDTKINDREQQNKTDAEEMKFTGLTEKAKEEKHCTDISKDCSSEDKLDFKECDEPSKNVYVVEMCEESEEKLAKEILRKVSVEIKCENSGPVDEVDPLACLNSSPLSPHDMSADLKALLDDDTTFSQLFPRDDEDTKRKKCPRVYSKKNKKQKLSPNPHLLQEYHAPNMPLQKKGQHVENQTDETFVNNQNNHLEYESISIDDAIMLNMCHNSSLKADGNALSDINQSSVTPEGISKNPEELRSSLVSPNESTIDKSTIVWSAPSDSTNCTADPVVSSEQSSTKEDVPITPCSDKVPPAPFPLEPCVTDNISTFQSIDIQNIKTTFQLPEIQFFDSSKDIPVGPPTTTTTTTTAEMENKDVEKSKKTSERRGRKRKDVNLKVKDKEYKCKVCFTWFLTLGELNFHKLSHNPSPPPTCYMCVQRKFSSREQLRDHLREKHAKNKAGIWTCGMCLKEISDVWMYNEHLREHATQFARKGQTQGSMLGIPGCFMQETAVKNFITSIMQHRPSRTNRESIKISKEQDKGIAKESTVGEIKTTETVEPKVHKTKSSNGTSEKPLEVLHKTDAPKNVEMHPNCKDPSRDCHHCGKQFPKPFKLQRHLVVHNLEKIFLCHKCPVSYQEAQELKDHLKRAHEEVEELDSKHTTLYTCELCADVMHVIKKSFICSTCNYTFSKKEQFDRHMEKHLSGGNKIFKFRGVLRPVKASASKVDECGFPASKKRKILNDSMQENSSDSGIASIGSLHLNTSSEMQSSTPKISKTDDFTQTSTSEYRNTNVKTEDIAEDYSDLHLELEKCPFHNASTKKEEIDPSPSQKVPDKESPVKTISPPCDVKEEDESVCIPAERTPQSLASKENSAWGEEKVKEKPVPAELGAAEKRSESRSLAPSSEDSLGFVGNPTITKTPASEKNELAASAIDQRSEVEQREEATRTDNNGIKKHSLSNGAEQQCSSQIKEKPPPPKQSDGPKNSSNHPSPRATEATQVSKVSSHGSDLNDGRESLRQQKKRKEMRSPHCLQRISSPAARENLDVDAKAKKKFRPGKCESPSLQRKPEGPSDYAVLSSVRDDAVSNKIVSKYKTTNSGLQPKRSMLDNCAPKKAEVVNHMNGDYKAKKGPLGRSLHSPGSKGPQAPMNNSLNRSRPKMGVRSMESHSYRTAESQNHLLSQLFGQKLTSFKIPLRKDTSESIN